MNWRAALVILSGPRSSTSVDCEKARKPEARAVDAALDGADGAAADIGRLFVRKARRSDEKQGLTLVVRQLCERRSKILEIQARPLLRLHLEPAGIGSVRIFDLAAALAVFGMEKVA